MWSAISGAWAWLNSNAGALGLLAAGVPLLWAGWQYLSQKRQELRVAEFEAYHRLIKELVGGDNESTMVDRQIAVVFELRRFKKYFEVSLRILRGLRENWGRRPDPEGRLTRLLKELDISIGYIESKY